MKKEIFLSSYSLKKPRCQDTPVAGNTLRIQILISDSRVEAGKIQNEPRTAS